MGWNNGSPVRVTLLGRVRASYGSEPVELGPLRQQAVLAALALRPGVTVGKRELADGIWGSEPPVSEGLPGYVYRLRRGLRDAGVTDPAAVLASDRGGYRLDRTATRVDATDLEDLAATASAARDAGDLATAAAGYAQALALFEGAPLTGLSGPFAEGQRQRLLERRIRLWQDRYTCQLRLGRHDDAVAELSALTAEHPTSEPLAALLIRALHASGRTADALAAYAHTRTRLAREAAATPGPTLQHLHRTLLPTASAPLDPTRAAGPGAARLAGNGSSVEPAGQLEAPAARSRPSQLPPDDGQLVGRGRELARLTADRGEPSRVVLVDGMAGVGKTALAVRAAAALEDRYPDGCLFVDLHGHTASRRSLPVGRALRQLLLGLGQPAATGHDVDELTAAWRSASAGLRLLVVLDDAASAAQVRPLLPTGTGSTVLVTSRLSLPGLDADDRLTLRPLTLDDAEHLLTDLIGANRPAGQGTAGRSLADQGLAGQGAAGQGAAGQGAAGQGAAGQGAAGQGPAGQGSAVRELAALCGRLPLALRIAAARLCSRPTWTVDHLRDRLTGDRLDELVAGDRGVRTALDPSYAHLPAPTRAAFRVLGLSPTTELDRLSLAAMLDCPPPRADRLLEDLVDAGLLTQPAPGRYRPHDLIAEYARRLAAEEPTPVAAARTGVFDLYAAAAQRAGDRPPPALPADPFGTRQDAVAWLDEAAGEIVGVVGHAAATGHPEHSCRMAEALVDYLTRQGRYEECDQIIRIALPLADRLDDRRPAAALRIALGGVDNLRGHFERAQTHLSEGLRISRQSGDLREQARARAALGESAYYLGRLGEGAVQLAGAAALARRIGDDWLLANATYQQGVVHTWSKRHATAAESFARTLPLVERTGDGRLTGQALCLASDPHLALGRPAEAAALLREATRLSEAAGDLPLQAFVLTRLGTAEEGLGDLDAAIEMHRRALRAVTPQTSTELELETRNRLGRTYLAAGRRAPAREQFELVLPLSATNQFVHRRARDRALAGLSLCG